MRWLTEPLPAIHGNVRQEPEDFVVEEILAYEPSGEGTHVWLRIEKTGVTTFDAVRRIARALGRKERDVGYAGLKDKHAIARQTLSIEFATEAEIEALELSGVRVVGITRHKNKLKLGHLAGNRFCIRVRDARVEDGAVARQVLDVLARRGVPNAFGVQRFGRDGATPELGRLLLDGSDAAFEQFVRLFARGGGVPADVAADAEPNVMLDHAQDPLVRRALDVWRTRGRSELGVRALPRRLLSLCTAALQSVAFNQVLERRLADLDVVGEGDIAFLHRNGACFLVDADAAADAGARARPFEISPSGPLFGPDTLAAAGPQGELEAQVAAELGIDPNAFAVRRPWAQKGARRALRIPLTDLSFAAMPAAEPGHVHLDLAFTLPRGAFATAVLAELFKPPAPSFPPENPSPA